MEAGRPDLLLISEAELGLVTDLYQLTMFAAYTRHRAGVRGCFELWFRGLPPGRNFLVAAGLEPALAFLGAVRFPPRQVEELRRHEPLQALGDDFFAALAEFRFTGDVWAIREGTPVFAGEPVLRVEAPIAQAQLVETYLLAAISFSTLVASKAARVRIAAGDRAVIDFGSRRAHGPQAACWAARSAYLAGLDGTANVWAGCRLGIPTSGTMAHSFVLSFASESAAFRAYAETFPHATVLLVDTFDTVGSVASAAADRSLEFVGIRLDSGDVAALARVCREILDAHGRRDVKIIASGDLDEHRIVELLGRGGPIDAFGVGTRLVTSADAPLLQGVYKLVAVQEDGETWHGVAKHSAGKETRPGAKQVWRKIDDCGRIVEDFVTARSDPPPQGAWEPLLEPWMEAGRMVRAAPDLEANRRWARAQIARLPKELLRLDSGAAFTVRVGDG
jgi:nicotinate phosphoribosyltransferase